MHLNMFKPTPPHLPANRIPGQHNRKSGAFWEWFRTAFRNRERRKMIQTLQGMDDRLLRDIGIERSDIPRVVDVFTDREWAVRPVSPDVEQSYRLRCDRAA